MNKITRYQAIDGTEFVTEEKCLEYERLLHMVELVMKPLGRQNDEDNSGKGWIQHNKEIVLSCRTAIIEICKDIGLGKNWPIFNHEPASEIHPMSVVGRVLDDMGGPLGAAWRRFARIDELGREHEQPYYAMNGPNKDQVCIEDRR